MSCLVHERSGTGAPVLELCLLKSASLSKPSFSRLYVWKLSKDNAKSTIGHNDVIRCFGVSSDSVHVITGSSDASLKVWTIAEGRLTQVSVAEVTSVLRHNPN